MPVFKDRTGQVFTRLTALRCVGLSRSGAVWLCRCSCDGKEIEVASSNLVSGGVASCGCLRREMMQQCGENHNGFKHGHNTHAGESRTYSSWCNMIDRCTNPNNPRWIHYGGASVPVQVCEGLREFSGFLSVLGERPLSTSLGRFSDLGNYSCGRCTQCQVNGRDLNCAWQTDREQKFEQKTKRQLAFLAA
jgi:hypothetical protein